MKILKASKERTKEDRSALRKTVGDIIENVIENGDAALLEYNHRFDGCDRASLRISKEEIEAAYKGSAGRGHREYQKSCCQHQGLCSRHNEKQWWN